ncbi:hypothetical protein H2200_007315 [Cladophialophora chaetospira]|uniref:Uncharacterized protein n=1 Tax=Cladophialophora chaetospira TaxID=386627 RepID=A0AA38X7K6_9EURO|nr:hypothetical protein H2200_007315 [Cladophialophora chaetospira]
MSFVINLARPQDPGAANMVQKKCSLKSIRKWYSNKAKSVAQSESQDPVDDFLAYQGDAEVRQFVRREQPPVQPEVSQQTQSHDWPPPQELPDTSKETEPVRNMSTVPSMCELDSASGYAYPSSISLASTVSADGNAGQSRPAQPPQAFPRWGTPSKAFEIDSTPAPKQLRRPQSKTFEIDSSPTAAAPRPFKSRPPYPCTPIETGPVGFRAYPGSPPPKPAYYIPPVLQPGYANGVPPALRPRYSAASLGPSQNEDTEPGTPSYSYPLVDLRDGLFLNANLSNPNVSYQDPRIPSIQFPSRGLQDEVSAELTRLYIPDHDEKQVFQPEPRAWMSPGSPMHQNAYEVEASRPETSHRPAPTAQVQRPPPIRTSTISPVSPLSSNAGRVSATEYNWPQYDWPRFIDRDYIDPAEEHSRNYRERRRDLWRGRAQQG